MVTVRGGLILGGAIGESARFGVIRFAAVSNEDARDLVRCSLSVFCCFCFLTWATRTSYLACLSGLCALSVSGPIWYG